MKTLLVIKREFWTRVRKKSFIIMTLLTPLIFIAMSVFIGYFATSGPSKKTIVVYDESSYFKNQLEGNSQLIFIFENAKEGELKQAVNDKQYDGFLMIPAFNENEAVQFNLYSKDPLGMETENSIQDQLNNVLISQRMQNAGIQTDELQKLQKHTIRLKTISTEGQDKDSLASYAIGYGSGMLLYFFMLFYGMSVMRSVMEEKTNRIAEIIISSVKPYQLMLGKIFGVALVGLAQFLIWILLLGGLVLIGYSSFSFSPDMGSSVSSDLTQQAGNQEILNTIFSTLSSTNWWMIISWFLFYFLGGYFLYAALFAAVGSLVDEDAQESQQFTLPITAPIIIAFVLMTAAIRDPNSTTAVVGSLIPFTSPIVMMARIPFGVPAWQLITSALLLILGFLGTTFVAAKIYRTGILLYGKKVTFKEIGKWLKK